METREPPRRREVSPEVIAERNARAILRPILREIATVQYHCALQDARGTSRHSTDGDIRSVADERRALCEKVRLLRQRVAEETAEHANTYAARSAHSAIENLAARLGSSAMS